MNKKKIIIGARGSKLAVKYAELAIRKIKKFYNGKIELKKIVTKGDRVLNRRTSDIGGKGLFLKQLEEALLSKEADIAVHSMKDIPAQLHSELTISAILRREDARDVFVSNKMSSIDEIQPGNKIGSSSIRIGGS